MYTKADEIKDKTILLIPQILQSIANEHGIHLRWKSTWSENRFIEQEQLEEYVKTINRSCSEYTTGFDVFGADRLGSLSLHFQRNFGVTGAIYSGTIPGTEKPVNSAIYFLEMRTHPHHKIGVILDASEYTDYSVWRKLEELKPDGKKITQFKGTLDNKIKQAEATLTTSLNDF